MKYLYSGNLVYSKIGDYLYVSVIQSRRIKIICFWFWNLFLILQLYPIIVKCIFETVLISFRVCWSCSWLDTKYGPWGMGCHHYCVRRWAYLWGRYLLAFLFYLFSCWGKFVYLFSTPYHYHVFFFSRSPCILNPIRTMLVQLNWLSLPSPFQEKHPYALP